MFWSIWDVDRVRAGDGFMEEGFYEGVKDLVREYGVVVI